MTDHNAADPMSRRNVLKASGGLLAGATLFVGSGSAATEEEPEPQFEIVDANEEIIVARVDIPEELYERINERGVLSERVFLGLADQFVIHEDEDAVSLPEDTELLAQPAEVEPLEEETYRMYFRTRDIHWPDENEDEEVMLGLGIFTERTMPIQYWNAEPYNPFQ